ncbi:MAG: MarR family transcriptional regulator [Flammeovirgaceae bacterium]|nr:MarR family transcriptional regulator [Flammeovirgaceae bacterium]MBE60974.1 MarR family transcriptional regulator [Flammeovirgaceae bacterium]HCX22315.1 Fic family protein [Cytophagales bacterium]|tara:strand:- start:11012 stop:12046 length:1035 start_codon:yes stop_codon:yes gene_type:complete
MKVYNFDLDFDWKLVNNISRLDRFDASWNAIEKKEGQTLKQLKSVATVRSVGASTRIEGSKMSDEEVDILLQNLSIEKLTERDKQEVAGYFEAFDIISEAHNEIRITENEIKNLHNILLKYCEKDQWHKGNYKQHSNNVEATLPDGTKQLVFQTTPPGFETDDAMRSLVEWYQTDAQTHPLVKSALFSYEFVSIHPFQDGNGRLSRLLASLLLLKNGYKWIQYVSLEHEIESRKPEYYRELRSCQAQRPNENVTTWINFFFSTLMNIQEQLLAKLEQTGAQSDLSPREKSILAYISDHAGCKSGDIASSLGIPNPTVKRILRDLLHLKLVERKGIGPGTNYSIQ